MASVAIIEGANPVTNSQSTEQEVTFLSDGIELAGNLHLPPGPGKHPAFIVLHGFAGSKDNSHAELMARLLAEWGYAALRFDFRGCGKSGGNAATSCATIRSPTRRTR